MQSLLESLANSETYKNWFFKVKTLDGAVLIAFGIICLMFAGLVPYIGFASVAYGAYKLFLAKQ